jgi:hypothetical protein
MHQDTVMDEHSILAAFSQTDGLPRAAVRAAATDRTRLAPRFIGLIEEFPTLLPAERPKQTPLFFIFQLLGDRREKAAYRTLAKILRLPDEHPAVVTASLAIGSPMAADQISIFSAISNSIIDLDAKITNRTLDLRTDQTQST